MNLFILNEQSELIWLPVGKSGYRPVTGFPEHPRELH
jgi:hypothetical protein